MVVIGLGSPFLTDDSVGPKVVRALAERSLPNVRLVESHAGGLLLLEELEGSERAVIIDALVDSNRSPGDVVIGGLQTATNNASCSHDCSLAETLHIGRSLGMALPADDNIHLVAIVAADVTTLSESLTPQIAKKLDYVCNVVCSLLDEKIHISPGMEAL